MGCATNQQGYRLLRLDREQIMSSRSLKFIQDIPQRGLSRDKNDIALSPYISPCGSNDESDVVKSVTLPPNISSSETNDEMNAATSEENITVAIDADNGETSEPYSASNMRETPSTPGAFPNPGPPPPSHLKLDFANPGSYWSAPLSNSRKSGRYIKTIALNAMHRAAEIKIPQSIKEARESPERQHWEEAMAKELEGLMKLNVFEELKL